MPDHPVGEGRDERPPSARARAELSAGVASDLDDVTVADDARVVTLDDTDQDATGSDGDTDTDPDDEDDDDRWIDGFVWGSDGE